MGVSEPFCKVGSIGKDLAYNLVLTSEGWLMMVEMDNRASLRKNPFHVLSPCRQQQLLDLIYFAGGIVNLKTLVTLA